MKMTNEQAKYLINSAAVRRGHAAKKVVRASTGNAAIGYVYAVFTTMKKGITPKGQGQDYASCIYLIYPDMERGIQSGSRVLFHYAKAKLMQGFKKREDCTGIQGIRIEKDRIKVTITKEIRRNRKTTITKELSISKKAFGF